MIGQILFSDNQQINKPKSHIFMKKIVHINAIDRQMRKKWMQLSKQYQFNNIAIKQINQLSPSQKHSFNTNHSSKQCQTSRPNDLMRRIQSLQNSLKRQKILSNHKKNQNIFYRKKSKKNLSSRYNLDLLPKKNIYNQDKFVSRKVKTQTQKSTYKINLSPQRIQKFDMKINSYQNSPQKKVNKSLQLPKMFLKRSQKAQKQSQIIQSKSQQQIMDINLKSQLFLKQRAYNQKNMLKKFKGTPLYYIMNRPIRFSQHLDKQY